MSARRRMQRLVRTAAAVVLLAAVGCATDEEAIAEAVAEALATAPAPTTTAPTTTAPTTTAPTTTAPTTTAPSDAALVSECREMTDEGVLLLFDWYVAKNEHEMAFDELQDANAAARGVYLARWERLFSDYVRATRASLRFGSRLAERCSDVSDAEVRDEIMPIDDLEAIARLLRAEIQHCRDAPASWEVDCPDMPSMSELLPGAR